MRFKLIWHRRFSAREVGELISQGWTVAGDRRSAVRNGQKIEKADLR